MKPPGLSMGFTERGNLTMSVHRSTAVEDAIWRAVEEAAWVTRGVTNGHITSNGGTGSRLQRRILGAPARASRAPTVGERTP